MKFLILFLTFSFLLISNLYSQPALEWVRTFDAEGAEAFFDIYALEDGGYVACGSQDTNWPFNGRYLIMKIDAEGREVWTNATGNITGAMYKTIIEADNGDYVAAGRNDARPLTTEVSAIRIDSDGEEVWSRTYSNGVCWAIIELKSGDFLLSGETSQRAGFLLLINGEGETIWERDYPIGEGRTAQARFTSMRETDHEVVVAGDGRVDGWNPLHTWLLKVDMDDGEIIWERHHNLADWCCCYTITSHPEGGFGLSGYTSNMETYLMKVDNDGEEEWTQIYEKQMQAEYGNSLAVMDDDGFAIAGGGASGGSHQHMVIRTMPDGQERWRGYYNFANEDGFTSGQNNLSSVIFDNDNSVVAAGLQNTSGRSYDGIIVKAEPNISGPIILDWTPEDTLVTALPGDSIEFSVHAEHQWIHLEYLWTRTNAIGTDTLSTDSSVTVLFDDLGDQIVRCHVSDGEVTLTISWFVDITEFYINRYSPDSLHLQYRRNGTIDFSVSTRSVEDDQVEYVWLLNGEQIADDDSVSIRFERGREHSVTAVASQGELSDSVTWQVLVNDLIVDYMPHRFDLSVPIDTTFEFEVFPLDENDDSLRFLWTLNGDSVSSRSWLLKNFDEEGLYDIRVYASDAVESDSLTWEVSVEANSIYADAPRHPDTATLYPPSPNPFNGTFSFDYYLPQADMVTFGLYDITGRSVWSMSQPFGVGMHRQSVDLNVHSAGVYFLRAESSFGTDIQRVVMLK